MTTIDKSKPVMVSGATGYVAGWLVKELLDAGITVHAPVRNPEDTAKLLYLNKLAENSSGKLKFFKADLLQQGSYFEAMQECELVFHTASPFINKVKNPQTDLVDPALIGTKNILNTANNCKTVKRIVLTSSVAAIIGDSIDCKNYPNGIATEEQWNFSSTINHQAYSFSKTVAERAAWEICNMQNRWDLVVINPSLVIGPGINPNATSESFKLVKQLGDGTLKMGAPEIYLGAVDVRDLAVAHFYAGYFPQAKGRYIISNENITFLKLAQILSEKYGNAFPFPKGFLPKFLIWLLAPLSGFKRKMISRNVGYQWLASNSKSIEQLGMKYRPIENSIIDMFQQMIDNKVFEK